VTAEWLERGAKGTRGARMKKCAETKNTPDQITILGLTRADFVAAALSAHGLQNSYVAGSVSGPNMKILWSGSPCAFISFLLGLFDTDLCKHSGGKNGAPLIQDDQDWKTLQQQLCEHTVRSRNKASVFVVFDLETMEGYKNRKRVSISVISCSAKF